MKRREEKGQKILVVDDEPFNVDLVEAILGPLGYQILKAYDGGEALTLVYKEKPDLILLDLMMPKVNGYHVLKWLKGHRRLRLIPVIILTAFADEKVKAFEAGADDFIAKPIDRFELISRVRAHLRMRSFVSELEYAESILYALARLVEARDAYTEEHIERVANLSISIGKKIGLKEEELDVLRKGALLHDIGKIGVPDAILLKPGKLVSEEFEIMKRHVIIGYRICRDMRSLRGSLSIIRYHHERWDGTGYPDGLKGEEIPLFARIVAVADAYDAMTSDRPYRKAHPSEIALETLESEAGKQWDPEIVKIALEAFPSVN
jgi:putative two-component system response regulator